MSELSNWEKNSKIAATSAGTVLLGIIAIIIGAMVNTRTQNELKDVQLRLDSMGIFDKIFHKSECKYLKNKKDSLSKKSWQGKKDNLNKQK